MGTFQEREKRNFLQSVAWRIDTRPKEPKQQLVGQLILESSYKETESRVNVLEKVCFFYNIIITN